MDGLEVSVIIPTYNRRTLLERAIGSVLVALREGDEVIVVDDASTDDTEKYVRGLGGPVRYLRQAHGGCARARNNGLAIATRPLIAFLDSDDEWVADKLILERQVMQQWPNIVFCFSDFGQRRLNGPESPRWLREWTGESRPWDQLFGPGVSFTSFGQLPAGREDFKVHVGSSYRAMLDAAYAWAQASLIRRSVAGKALTFVEDQPFYDDWECFALLSKLGDTAFLDCTTFWQWEHNGPRLTDMAFHDRAVCQLRMLGRVWGRDEEFLKVHRSAFDRVSAKQHLVIGRRALTEGRMGEARAELRQAGTSRAAKAYRFVASLPGPMVHGIRAIKRLVPR